MPARESASSSCPCGSTTYRWSASCWPGAGASHLRQLRARRTRSTVACASAGCSDARARGAPSGTSQTQSSRSLSLPRPSRSWRCRYRCFSQAASQAPPATLTSSHWPLQRRQRHRLAVQRGRGERRQRPLRLDQFAVVAPALGPDHVIGEVGRDHRRRAHRSTTSIFSGPRAVRRPSPVQRVLRRRQRMHRQAQRLVKHDGPCGGGAMNWNQT